VKSFSFNFSTKRASRRFDGLRWIRFISHSP
jgi:hypothetical protein